MNNPLWNMLNPASRESHAGRFTSPGFAPQRNMLRPASRESHAGRFTSPGFAPQWKMTEPAGGQPQIAIDYNNPVIDDPMVPFPQRTYTGPRQAAGDIVNAPWGQADLSQVPASVRIQYAMQYGIPMAYLPYYAPHLFNQGQQGQGQGGQPDWGGRPLPGGGFPPGFRGDRGTGFAFRPIVRPTDKPINSVRRGTLFE